MPVINRYELILQPVAAKAAPRLPSPVTRAARAAASGREQSDPLMLPEELFAGEEK